MKDLDKDIEKKLNEQFNEQDFEIQDAWLEDMSSKLDAHNKKSNKKFFFWLFTGAFVLLGGASLLWNNFNFLENEQTAVNSIEQKVKQDILVSNESTSIISEALACEEDEIVKNETSLKNIEKDNLEKSNFKKQDLTNAKRIQKNTENIASNKDKPNGLAKLSNKNILLSENKSLKEEQNRSEFNTSKIETEKNNKQGSLTGLKNKNFSLEKNTINVFEENKEQITSEEQSKTKENKTLTSATKIDAEAKSKESGSNTLAILENNNTSLEKNKRIVSEESNQKNALEENSKIQTNTNLEKFEENKLSAEQKALVASKEKTSSLEKNRESIVEESLEEIALEEEAKKEKQDSVQEVLNLNEAIDSIQEKLEDKKVNPKKDLGLSLALNAGPSILIRNFKTDTQNEKRTLEESNKIAWNLNLELYKNFKNNLILGTGVNLTNYGEKINYSSISETFQNTSVQVEAFDYLNLNITKTGSSLTYDTTQIVYYDTTRIITDSVYENTSIQKDKGSTNFTYIEIPVLIGYQILNTKKWSLNAVTGISAGFLVRSNGSYINTANNLEPAMNKKLIFNYLLSAQLNYKVYKNLNLSLAPNFKYNLNNVSTYSGTRKRYASFGVNAGLIINF